MNTDNKDVSPIVVDLATIPMILGETMADRLNKWLELYDKGICLIDSSQI